MRFLFFFPGALIILFLSSCQHIEKARGRSSNHTEVMQEIIRHTVTDHQGRVLAMAFNNAKETATLVWQGETIELQQERMASGTKYSNATYELTEHKGELTLKKGGNVVFTHMK